MKQQGAARIYFRLMSYLLPMWKRVVVLLLVTAIFALLSGISLTLIPPFLNILFNEDPEIKNVDQLLSEDHSRLVPDQLEKRIEIVKMRAKEIIYRGEPTERLARFCIIFFSLMVIKNIFGYFSAYMNIAVGQTVLKAIRDELYGKIQQLPMSYFDRNKTGHLISKITNDVTMLRGAVVGGLASIIQYGLMTLIAITIIFYTSWKLSLLTMVLVPANIFLIVLISRKLRKGSIRAQARMADITMVLQETISGVRVVKAFGMEKFEKKKFARFNLQYLKEYLKMRKFAELARPSSEALGMIASVIVLWYGGKLVISGELDPANLMMFIGTMLWVVNPIKRLSKLNSEIQEGIGCGQRVFSIMDYGSEGENQGDIEIDNFRDRIEYRDVSFSYTGEEDVLKGIDLTIHNGEIVAIVGVSGTGKSTLADLLPRFYPVTSGRILLDGIDINDIKLSSLRSLMGIVTQETILFNDTVFNNIAYGMESCTREDVVKAAVAANADSFISEMKEGYDTEIGDRGIQLSGGQRQRLAIARALLKNPQILILDEATSSLDVESEALVQEAIDHLVKGRTALVIAHRLSTVKNADKIVVLEDGRISQAGNHEDLINEEGTYRKLYKMHIRE
ncbi:MAG: ABC transporter transmembrane domain-containing protein [Candidatus Krumholzibacteriales bacterium]